VAIAAGCAALGACRSEAPTAPAAVVPIRALTAVEQRAASASNGFAFTMLRQLAAATPAENVVLSPLSGSAALGMTLHGADGETRAGMQRALGVADLTVEQASAAYRDLVPLLLTADPAVTIRSANALWQAPWFTTRPAFDEAMRTYYGATTRPVDFADAVNAAATMNRWASEQTSGRIPKVFEPDQLSADLVLVLMNALYFKGPWAARFDARETRPRPFTLGDGSTVNVPTMFRATVPLRTGADAGAEVAELPFGGGAYAMTLVMPARGRSLDALVASLDASRWTSLVATLRDDTRDVYLPKLELAGERLWNAPLQALGMIDAFSPARADFSPLSSQCAPGAAAAGRCVISFVKQNVWVRVDEEGAEAAAVTSVGVGITSLPAAVAIDRPFVFAIRERSTGAVLFLGAVRDPRAR
jgi:serpin B